METALQLSDRWQITAAPVLLWRSKLKRAAQECDDTLRHLTQRQRAVVDEEFMLRLSESSDVLGIIARCMQAVTPHLKAAAEGFTRELVQLPTQDFSWVESLPFRETEYWVDIHRTLTQCLRPDPLCCSGHDGFIVPSTCSSSKSDGQSSLSPSKSSFAFEVIDGEEQETVHRNATLQDVDEKLLPKAVDHLRSTESKMYQLCLRSRHGTAQLCVEKTTPATRVPSKGTAASRLHINGSKRVVDRKREDYRIKGWQDASRDLLKLWVVRASDKLHGSLSSWTVRSPLQS
ncbi:unnamed protein product [Triticum turgidum subsp. durum]|uniref:Uncharacterized protein n=1 Tax=Triticum turgidum subsp. durum TaxID=4567 RepID=A0A9R0RDD0_TRITD|nr:unnamed protein product [Triticum turgidum subsp. durum]